MKEKTMNGKTIRVHENNGITLSLYQLKSGKYQIRWTDGCDGLVETYLDIVVSFDNRFKKEYLIKLFDALVADAKDETDGVKAMFALGHAGMAPCLVGDDVVDLETWKARQAGETYFIGNEDDYNE